MVAATGKAGPAFAALGKGAMMLARVAPFLGLVTTAFDIYMTVTEDDPVHQQTHLGHALLCGTGTALTFAAFAFPASAAVPAAISAVQFVDRHSFGERLSHFVGGQAMGAWRLLTGRR